MSRVLLFVQTGDGRPKCAGVATLEPERRRTTQHSHNMAGYYVSLWAMLALRAADRWWLVECENADAGRGCIALSRVSGWVRREFNDDVLLDRGIVTVRGRILASGGRP